MLTLRGVSWLCHGAGSAQLSLDVILCVRECCLGPGDPPVVHGAPLPFHTRAVVRAEQRSPGGLPGRAPSRRIHPFGGPLASSVPRGGGKAAPRPLCAHPLGGSRGRSLPRGAPPGRAGPRRGSAVLLRRLPAWCSSPAGRWEAGGETGAGEEAVAERRRRGFYFDRAALGSSHGGK